MSIDGPIDYPDKMDSADHDAEYFITGAGTGANAQIVHLPAPESSRDKPVTRCKRLGEEANRYVKDPAVYPRGYRDVCRKCLRHEELEAEA